MQWRHARDRLTARTFDIIINHTTLVTESLERPAAGAFVDKTYPLPERLTVGDKPLNVRFQAHPGNMAGGIFGLRLLAAPQ